MEEIYRTLGIDKEVYRLGEEVLSTLRDRFIEIDANAEYRQLGVIDAMQRARLSEAHLSGTTGYGYNDIGRDALEAVYAGVFHTEDALVRPQIASGTAALQLCFMGLLRPGDILYSPCGKPYDTLEEVIGIRDADGSLREFGIDYLETPLVEDGGFDFPAIEAQLKESRIRLVTIQRSKGYQTRPSFTIDTIRTLIDFIRAHRADVTIMVDNCYGEFVERLEPTDAGADLVAGSLIKNPGGGLAPSGGYVCGRRDLVEKISHRLTSPGLGKEVGASLQTLPACFEGLFLAPYVTASALKGAIFAASLYEKIARESGLPFTVHPASDVPRTDIIEAVTFHDERALTAFCEGIQSASPVDAHVRPEPWEMPGYDCPVIMAAGAFISGSSIELSADGPVRAPYTVFFQGGLTFAHAKLGILKTVQKLSEYGIFDPKTIQ